MAQTKRKRSRNTLTPVVQRKTEAQRQRNEVKFSLTDAEYKKLLKKCKARGEAKAAFCRRVVLNKKVRAKPHHIPEFTVHPRTEDLIHLVARVQNQLADQDQWDHERRRLARNLLEKLGDLLDHCLRDPDAQS